MAGSASSTAAGSGARLAPLVLATMAAQGLLVVLAPTTVAIAEEFGTSVGAVGQARTTTAAVAVVVALAILPRADALGVRRLLATGAGVGILGCAAVAVAPSLPTLLLAHVLVGLGFAALLSGAFAGVAAFPAGDRDRAMGHVAAANGLAWIVANPIVGALTESLSWRWAQAVPAAIALAALLTAARASNPAAGAAVATTLRSLLAVRPARRWAGAELIAFGAWSALLTFGGAFFIEELGAGEATVGWLLAAGAAAYYVAATRSAHLIGARSRRRVVAWTSIVMGLLCPVLLGAAGSIATGVVVFCLIGLVAGVRTPAASSLGLEQLPGHPGAMMAARTAAIQAGYLVGAVAGGALIAGPGYAALGFALAAGMAAAGLMVLRIEPGLREVAGPRADLST